jgi:hypothetical protein
LKPVAATNPGRIKSVAEIVAADAFRPKLAKDEKITSEREAKLFRSNAKKPT